MINVDSNRFATHSLKPRRSQVAIYPRISFQGHIDIIVGLAFGALVKELDETLNAVLDDFDAAAEDYLRKYQRALTLIVDETDLLAHLDLEFLRRLLLHAKKAVDKKNYNVIFVCTDGKRIVPRHPYGIFL